MNDPLNLFDEPEQEAKAPTITPLTDTQRVELRTMFAALEKTTAREQFALVEELIGVRLARVGDLSSPSASLLIERLRKRVASHSRTSTGSAWDDREEDTWIDRL